jgi:hypothetical protein
VNSITSLIQEAAWRSTPPEIIGKDSTSFTPLHIRELVTDKRRARNRWQRSRNPIDKREYNQQFGQKTDTAKLILFELGLRGNAAGGTVG